MTLDEKIELYFESVLTGKLNENGANSVYQAQIVEEHGILKVYVEVDGEGTLEYVIIENENGIELK
jgi:uncharacterized protein with ACT and thioredoxin-like domain